MLFTAAAFVLLFLPVTLAGFFLVGRRYRTGAAIWLLLASLFFYGYWMPEFTLLLVVSILINFGIGLRLVASRRVAGVASGAGASRLWLTGGIAFNLGLLGYFKYANFFVSNLGAALGTDLQISHVVLPIGISFYTFTQIAFLVDTWQGKVGETNLVHYGLFVTYFPHLIAGPVLHHAQMMPQFADATIYRPRLAHITGGMAIFAIGLLKKVVLADGVSPYADAVFNPVDAGVSVTTQEAWLGAAAYTVQLYFDFSGYSDMAIGLSWMFNVRLPFNFDSPYRATSIADFWRRWHISLSTFLRDYLYIPLGGNRLGSLRRHVNLFATMVLGGLWHGASWSFVLWGALHGIYLIVNHAIGAALNETALQRIRGSWVWTLFAWGLTMTAIIVAWVPFRAVTLDGATRILQAMAGFAGPNLTPSLLWNAGLNMQVGIGWCGLLGLIAVVLPNSNRIGAALLDHLRGARLEWQAMTLGLVTCGSLLLVLVNTARDAVSAFIYFNF